MPATALTAEVAAQLENGVSSAAELMKALTVSQPTISRTLRTLELDERVLRMGSTRGARYGLRRNIAAIGSRWPLYRIDEAGVAHELGTLNAIARDGYCVSAGPQRLRGLFDAVPYYLQDARPTGFLGRAVPTAYPELGLPPRVTDWTDEHFLTYLTRRGLDTGGNLVVGIEALNRHLASMHPPNVVSLQNRAAAYPDFATASMDGSPPGSSAQGENPKFTACIADRTRMTQVIVKFSPPRSSAIGQRWADLLLAEHLAHGVLQENGIAACPSQWLEYGDRVFLECERFDRIGAEGRRGVVSLLAVDAARYGALDTWTAAAQRLVRDALLSDGDAERIRFLDAFGALISNTDRHFGNVTLFDHFVGRFEMAPVYDMLPMLFAPQDGHLVERPVEATPARAEWLSVWGRARALAEAYWDRISQERRVSTDFQRLGARCLAVLRAMPRRGASGA